jgi:hypothetical protein
MTLLRPNDACWDRAYQPLSLVYPEVRVTSWSLAEPGWCTAAALSTNPQAFADVVAYEAAGIEADWATAPRPYVAATWALLHYGFYAAFAVAGPYLAAGLIPDLDLEGFAFQLPRHQSPGTAGWNNDGSDHRDQRPTIILAVQPRGWTDVADTSIDEARSELRRVHAQLFGPVLMAGRRAARRSPRALWRAAADMLAGAMWRIGERLGDESSAAHEAALVLGDMTGPIPPYAGGANFRELPLPGGGTRLTRERNDCCLAYTLGTGDPCITCPRLDDAQRAQLLEIQRT